MGGRAVAFLFVALAEAGLLEWGLYQAESAEMLPNGALLRLSCIGVA